jgi:hypothetical protein
MAVVLPTAHSLGTQSALVDPIDGSSSNTDYLVVFADTNIGAVNQRMVMASFVLPEALLLTRNL